VVYDNRDLYEDYAELRHRIGLVPQENILHTQLTARRALQYSAELRFPADTTAAERDARVTEVMEELGLAKHAQTRADRLSGGQLKRMNVAQELLTRPSLLFLDEPPLASIPASTSRSCSSCADLAHDGRTIIVVTHSVLNLMVCDRLLVLAPGRQDGLLRTAGRGARLLRAGRLGGPVPGVRPLPRPRLGGRVRRVLCPRAVRGGAAPTGRGPVRRETTWRRRSVAAGCGSMPR